MQKTREPQTAIMRRSGRRFLSLARGPARTRWNPAWLSAAGVSAGVIAVIFIHLFGIVILAEDRVPLTTVQLDDGLAFVSEYSSDRLNWPWRFSTTRLVENGVEIGPGNSLHEVVRRLGDGRFAPWRGYIYFSSTDGSDPTASGYNYEVVQPMPVPLWATALLAICAAFSLLRAAPGASIAAKSRAAFGTSRATLLIGVVTVIVLLVRPWKFLHSTSFTDVFIVIAIALSGLLVSGRQLPKSFLIIVRTVAFVFAFLLLARMPDPIAGASPYFSQIDLALRALGVSAAIASWWRPSLSVLALAAYAWTNVMLTRAYDGLPVDGTGDWIPLMEVGMFMIAVVGGFQLLLVLVRALRPNAVQPLTAQTGHIEGLVLVAAAVHMANYTHSAIAKFTLNGGPLSWLTENQTHWLFLNSVPIGVAPFGAFPALIDWLGHVMEAANPLTNVLTLSTQILGFIGIAFPVVGSVLFVIYDVFHVGIAALTGIVFWKWALMNVAFIAAFGTLAKKLGLHIRVAGVVMCLVAPMFFTIIMLGWYDTPAVNVVRVEAELTDGRRVEVPSDFFRQHSYMMTTFYGWRPALMARLYPTETWGTTDDYAIAQEAEACGAPDGDTAAGNASEEFLIHPAIFRLIGDLHRAAKNAQDNGRWRPLTLYPHHIFSTPFAYEEFYRIDMDEVVSYIVHATYYCHDVRTLEATPYVDVVAGVVQVAE